MTAPLHSNVNTDAFIENLDRAIVLKQQLFDDEISSLAASIHQKYMDHRINKMTKGWLARLLGRNKSDLMLTYDDVRKIIVDYSKSTKDNWHHAPFKHHSILWVVSSNDEKENISGLYWENRKINLWKRLLNEAKHAKKLGSKVITEPGNMAFMDLLEQYDKNIQ